MINSWETKPLQDCLEKVSYTNKIERKNFLLSGKYPVISQEKDFVNGFWDDDNDVFLLKKPVVVFGDHTKVIKYINFNFVIGADGVKILQPKNNIEAKYLYYFLCSIELEDLGYARHYRLLKEIHVSFPKNSHEQRRIVAILDEAFAGIAAAKENAEQNLKNAKEVFETYSQIIFTNACKNANEIRLGDTNLIEIIDGDRGKSYPKKEDFSTDGYCLFLSTKNVKQNGFLFEDKVFISKDKHKKMRNGKLERNDVVMTTRGTIGNLGWYNHDILFNNIRINSGMLIFRPNINKILPEYLFKILGSKIIQEQIIKNTSGAAQPQLPIKTLSKFTLPVPKSLSEQRQVVSQIDNLSAETSVLESIYQQKLANLEELKKSLLQQAFSGAL